MIIEEMKKLKKEHGLTNEQISEHTGIPLGTVRKIFSGETKQPRYAAMQALEKYFSDPHLPIYPGPKYDFYPDQPPLLLKERSIAEDYMVHRDGTYTADDLDRLRGDDGRGELIDGVIFNLASPSVSHQLIQTAVASLLNAHIWNHGGSCDVFTSPLDVHIEKNDWTVLQPDVLIICSNDLYKKDKIWGAPDLVVEILSPSTQDRDFGAKYMKYRSFGVREYWIIDPMNERIIVYEFARNDMIHLYTFQDKIPVGIWDGDCVIDFAPIAERIRVISGEGASNK